jgi:hypothetical protein
MRLGELQTAMFETLSGDPNVSGLAVAVYSDPQQQPNPEDDAAFPYITFGEDSFVPWDTKTDFGAQVTCQIDIYSREHNFTKLKALTGYVYDALHHQPLTIVGADHTLTTCESANVSRSPDGTTKRCLMSFRVLYDNIS